MTKIIFSRDFELKQWSASKIQLCLSNAYVVIFLEENSFQIDTGIAFDISKNHILMWLWTETMICTASKIQLFLSNTSVATFLEENSFQIDTGIAFYISKKTIFTWLWTEWSASKIQLLLSNASVATFGVKLFQIDTGIALTFQKIIFWRDFELNQWSVSKINLLLSNASTATFLEVNSFPIETGIAFDVSKNGFLNLQKFWVLFLIKVLLIKQFSLAFLLVGFYAVGDSATGLFCCGRFYCWTFLLWEILMLDFLASGQMNRQAHKTAYEISILSLIRLSNNFNL